MSENENIFNLKKFHESTTEELQSVKNRVRNLIGDVHWPEDGRYKEAILRNMIRKFLPLNYTIGTGFIVDVINEHLKPSTQIDILIFDSNYPTLFSEGDFYIVTKNSVKAVIEVKTDVSKSNELDKAIEKINKIGSLLNSRQSSMKPPFLGIFSYDGVSPYPNGTYRLDRIKNKIKNQINNETERKWMVNHISLNEDIFIKYWENKQCFSVYNLKKLSFSFFISNVITKVTNQDIKNEFRTWFPLDKEREKLFDIELD